METLIGFKIIGFVLRFIIVPYNQPYFVQENSVLLSWVVGDGAFWFYVPCCLLSVYIMYYIYILYSKRLETSWNRISAFGIYKSYTLKHLKKTIMSENPIILMNPWMYCPFIKVGQKNRNRWKIPYLSCRTSEQFVASGGTRQPSPAKIDLVVR